MKQAMKRALIVTVIVIVSVLLAGSQLPEYSNPFPTEVLKYCGIITDGHGCGSVVVIGPDLLLTAGHCIGYPDMYVEINGQRYEIVEDWADPEEDVGFLRIDPNGALLVPIQLGPMPELLDTVYLVGSPYGPDFANTITKGVVSHLDRDIYGRDDLVQTDAEGAPGSSGGPLFDEQGRIVGICVIGPNPGGGVTLCEPVIDIRAALGRFQHRPEKAAPNAVVEDSTDAEQGDQ